MADGAKFCPACGAPAGAAVKPASEKFGNIRKCPACGADVPSMAAKCPECGHEFNVSRVSDAISQFTNDINEVEAQIARASTQGVLGWAGWPKVLRIAWCVLNVFTWCIPLVISLIRKVLFPPKPVLSGNEVRKQQLISNFVVPNNREDLLESMLFASSKVRESANMIGQTGQSKQYTLFWTRVWVDKCHQIYEKAKIVLPDEAGKIASFNEAMQAGEAVIKKEKTVNLIKLIAATVVLVGGIAAISISSTGALVKVPESKTFALDNVAMTGAIADGYKITGDGVTIKTVDGGKSAVMTVTFEKLPAADEYIARKIDNILAGEGWKKEDCGISFRDGEFILSGHTISRSYDSQNALVQSVVEMEANTTKTVKIPLAEREAGKTKEELATLMKLDELTIGMKFSYGIKNSTADGWRSVSIE